MFQVPVRAMKSGPMRFSPLDDSSSTAADFFSWGATGFEFLKTGTDKKPELWSFSDFVDYFSEHTEDSPAGEGALE